MSVAISVIIPWYQGQRYLPGLLSMMERNAEILRGEAGKEMEVLLVNDSPWENLETELKKQADGAAAYRLKVITNPQNSGIHATRVNGLNAAQGEFIQFLDQDDRITDRCLLSQYRSIGDADFVIGNGYDGEQGGGRHLIFASLMAHAAAGDLKCQYYYNNLIRSPGQVLIRKSSIPAYWLEQIMKNNGSQMEVAEKLKGIASPIGMWAFCRRAKYYCTSDAAHKLRYPDVGLLRAIYSHARMKA